MAEVARRASSSVGAFYARFKDKEALLRCVLARFYEQAAATSEVALHDERWLDSSLESTLNTLIRFMIEVLRERRPLVMTMMMRAPSDPTLTALTQRLQHQIGSGVGELLARRGQQLDHPDPPSALRMCVWLILSAIENRLLYANGGSPDGTGVSDSSPMDWGDDRLARELTTMAIRYLGMHPPGMPKQNMPLSPRSPASAATPVNLS